MTENIDSLLNDLEHLVMPSPRGHSLVPHPPHIDKSQNNPKNKFVVRPSATQPCELGSEMDYCSSRASSAERKKYSSTTPPPTKANGQEGHIDDASLDNLLEMLQSPDREKKATPAVNPQQSTFGMNSGIVSASPSLPSFGSAAHSSANSPAAFSWGAPTPSHVIKTPPGSNTSDGDWDSPTSTGGAATSGGGPRAAPLRKASPSPPKSSHLFHIPTSTSSPPSSSGAVSNGGGIEGYGNVGNTSSYGSIGHNGSGGSNSKSPMLSLPTPSSSSGSGYSSGYGNVSGKGSPSAPFSGRAATGSTAGGGVRASSVRTLHKAGGGSAASASAGKTRCNRVVIAGSGVSRGSKTSAFSKSACDCLRCLQCNFEVLQFADIAWDDAVDYMFFRNNVPNTDKLSVNFLSKPGSCAYCCQCTWRSVEEDESLVTGSTSQPQWLCSGHS